MQNNVLEPILFQCGALNQVFAFDNNRLLAFVAIVFPVFKPDTARQHCYWAMARFVAALKARVEHGQEFIDQFGMLGE